MFRRIRSIRIKALILVSLVAAAALGGLFAANTLWQREMALTRIRETGAVEAELIKLIVSEPMVIGDNAATTAQFAKIAASRQHLKAYLTDFQGRITYATDAASLRRPLAEVAASPGLSARLQAALTTAVDGDGLETGANATASFATVRAIQNAPECHHCHGASRSVLGALVTVADVGPDMAALAANQQRTALVSLAGLAVLVAGLLLFMKYSIIDRLALLAAVSQRIAGGDMDACQAVAVRVNARQAHGSGDEITVLGSGLCTLVATLRGKIAEADAKTTEAASQADRAGVCLAEAETAREAAARARHEGAVQAAQTLEGVLDHLATATAALTDAVSRAGSGARTQKDAALETAAAINQMNESVADMAKIAAGAAKTSAEAKDKASLGADTVRELAGCIAGVRELAEALRRDIAALGQEAQGIGQIINVISDIADQTNLLALNAAIEAARAGDAGRGFAVVADEVRKLAEKTMHATKDVEKAVTSIQAGTQAHVDSVQEAASAIETASTLAHRSGEALSGIVELVTAAARQVRSIAASCEDQSAVSDEIGRSVDGISAISQDTAETMEQADLAVGRLASQAESLKRLTDDMLDEPAAQLPA